MTIDLEAIKARAAAATEPTDGDTWIIERSPIGVFDIYTGRCPGRALTSPSTSSGPRTRSSSLPPAPTFPRCSLRLCG
jgi:hypothetical protein